MRPPRAQRRRSSTWDPRGFSGGRLGGMGGGCGQGPAPGLAAPGLNLRVTGRDRGGEARPRNTWRLAARGQGSRAGFPNIPVASGRRLSEVGGPFHLPPTPGNSWMNPRSAFVDTGVSSLPPAVVSPQVLTRMPSGGRRARSCRLSLGPGSPRGGAQWRTTRPRGIWEGAAPRAESVGRLPLVLFLPSPNSGPPGLQSQSEA